MITALDARKIKRKQLITQPQHAADTSMILRKRLLAISSHSNFQTITRNSCRDAKGGNRSTVIATTWRIGHRCQLQEEATRQKKTKPLCP